MVHKKVQMKTFKISHQGFFLPACLHQGWQSHICYKIQIVLMLLIWRLGEPRRLSSATGCCFQRWYFWLIEKTWMILRYLSLVPVFLYTVRLTTWNNATSPREVSVPCQYSSRDGTRFFQSSTRFRQQTKCGSWIFPVLREGWFPMFGSERTSRFRSEEIFPCSSEYRYVAQCVTQMFVLNLPKYSLEWHKSRPS